MSKRNYIFIVLIFIFSLIIQTKSNIYSDSLEIVAKFNIIKFDINSSIEECKKCMPAGIKLSKNGTIFCSFPRWFDDVIATFAKYNDKTNNFEPWPSFEINQRYKTFNSSGLNLF